MYEPIEAGVARLYEMGVPVVTLDCAYSIEVMQKVPLTMDRTNVPPAFIKELQVAVLNQMKDHIKGEQAAATWVTEAISDKRIKKDAVAHVIGERFGKDAVAYDPSDREANERLAGQGRIPVAGRSLPAAAWEQVRKAGVLPAAGKVSPTPKPFGNGPTLKLVKTVTPEMDKRRDQIDALARALLGHGVLCNGQPTWAGDSTGAMGGMTRNSSSTWGTSATPGSRSR